jgi:hypothetical protein
MDEAGLVNKANCTSVEIQRYEQGSLPSDHEDMILGHLIFNPSSHRRYKSSAIGDFLEGASCGSKGETRWLTVSDDEGRPEMISWSSVTTNPLEVISLFRMMRL